jgi:hypothetical protein
VRRLLAFAVAGGAGLLAGAACSSDDGAPAASSASASATSVVTTSAGSASSSTAVPVSLVVPQPEISGDNPPRPDELDPPAMPTVCALLSTQEVADATGQEVASSEEGGEVRDELGCQFLSGSGDPVLRLVRMSAGHSPPPRELLAELLAESGATPHPDVGDGAVVTAELTAVLVGDRLYTLAVLAGDAQLDQGALLDLAALVASRA